MSFISFTNQILLLLRATRLRPFHADFGVYMTPWHTLRISESHWGNKVKCSFSRALPAPVPGIQINLFYFFCRVIFNQLLPYPKILMHVIAYLSFENIFLRHWFSIWASHWNPLRSFKTEDSWVLSLFSCDFSGVTAQELGFIKGFQVAPKFSHWAPWGWRWSCQSSELGFFSQIWWMPKKGRQSPCQEASQYTESSRQHPPPLGSIPGHFTVALNLISCHGFQGSSLRRPLPLVDGKFCNQATAQGCSCESLYWQIFIKFNEINLRNKSPRWHL